MSGFWYKVFFLLTIIAVTISLALIVVNIGFPFEADLFSYAQSQQQKH